MMLENLTPLLDSLTNVGWFTNVGTPYDTDDVLLVSGWDQAISELAKCAKTRTYVVPVNQIRNRIRVRASDAYQSWNSISDAIRPKIDELTESKTRNVELPAAKLKLLRDHISWDVMHACMETQYRAVCDIEYHRRRMALLAEGRFPCGWQGAFPQGKHIVY